jgi:WD40 repeat protein/tRNA A-37 threonylcarbamoyl transferase component Bud32
MDTLPPADLDDTDSSVVHTAVSSPMEPAPACPLCGAAQGHDGVCPRCELAIALESSSMRAPDPRGEVCGSIPKRFGDYELLQEIGHGGMGVVYKARHEKLQRVVALKLLLLGRFSSPSAIKRFQREAQAAASLRHPHLVAIHEIGEIEGQHYLTMEFVEGRNLAALLRHGPLPPRQAAGYCRTLADAISAAHRAGIIHRDLKPSNILIDPFDQPRVTDFGLAKRFGDAPKRNGSADAGPTNEEPTLAGQILGSPNYLAPELAAGREKEAGPATDIFSIGAILYECLTGRPPFMAATLQETLVRIRDTDPVAPRVLNVQIPRDLETICLRCLAKEAQGRYPSAHHVADELGRFLAGEPIQARPISAPGKVWRWCRRKPALAAAVGLVLLLVLVVGIGSPIATYRINEARNAEATERQRAEEALTARHTQLYAAEVNLANEALRDFNLNSARHLLERHRPEFGVPASAGPGSGSPDATADRLKAGPGTDLRGFEWRYVYAQCRNQEQATLGPFSNAVTVVRFTPDGNRLVVGDADGNASLWDRATRKPIAAFPAQGTFRTYHHVSGRRCLAISPEATTLAVGAGNDLALWELTSGRPKPNLRGHSNIVSYLEFSPDGHTLASGAHDDTARLWDFSVDPPAPLAVLNVGFAVYCAAFSADGGLLALAGAEFDVKLWDVSNVRAPRELPPFKGHITAVFGLAFSPVDRVLASGGAEIFLSHLGPRGEVTSVRKLARGGHSVGIIDFVTFARDGQTLISAGTDRNLTLWDLAEKREPVRLMGHEGEILSVAVSPDGRWLASAGYDRTVKLWDVSAPGPTTKSISHSAFVMAAAFSPDSKLVASMAYRSPTLKLSDVASLEQVAARDAVPNPNNRVVFSPDGRVLAVDSGGKVRLLGVPSLAEITNVSGGLPAFSPDGSELIRVRKGSVYRRNLKTGAEHGFSTGWDDVSTVLVLPDGRRIAAAGGASFAHARLWNADAKEPPIELGSHNERVHSFACSTTGQWLAAAIWDGTIRIWNLANLREPPRTLTGHKGSVWAVAFSPDGRTLATGADDYTIKLWNVASWQEAATLRGHTHLVSALTFSPDGKNLASCSGDGTVRIWRAPALEELARAGSDGNVAPP